MAYVEELAKGGDKVDHAIAQLKSYMRATLEMYDHNHTPKEEFKGEIKVYPRALNELEIYYYGEVKTRLEDILYQEN